MTGTFIAKQTISAWVKLFWLVFLLMYCCFPNTSPNTPHAMVSFISIIHRCVSQSSKSKGKSQLVFQECFQYDNYLISFPLLGLSSFITLATFNFFLFVKAMLEFSVKIANIFCFETLHWQSLNKTFFYSRLYIVHVWWGWKSGLSRGGFVNYWPT